MKSSKIATLVGLLCVLSACATPKVQEVEPLPQGVAEMDFGKRIPGVKGFFGMLAKEGQDSGKILAATEAYQLAWSVFFDAHERSLEAAKAEIAFEHEREGVEAKESGRAAVVQRVEERRQQNGAAVNVAKSGNK
ncbi:hypothetical protein OAO01_00965 [Oligoflexia bacterium]|nr:hypothetical protein [Oligoflexia bacterium]